MTGRLLTTFKKKIHELTLVPGGGGCFELSINGELAYSKLATGKFPDEANIVELVQQKLTT